MALPHTVLFAYIRERMKKDEKERKKDNVSPLGLHQVRDRLEKTKEQSKYKQYKVEKPRRQSNREVRKV